MENNIWHTKEQLPEDHRDIVVIYGKGKEDEEIVIFNTGKEVRSDLFIDDEDGTIWAYIEDLVALSEQSKNIKNLEYEQTLLNEIHILRNRIARKLETETEIAIFNHESISFDRKVEDFQKETETSDNSEKSNSLKDSLDNSSNEIIRLYNENRELKEKVKIEPISKEEFICLLKDIKFHIDTYWGEETTSWIINDLVKDLQGFITELDELQFNKPLVQRKVKEILGKEYLVKRRKDID